MRWFFCLCAVFCVTSVWAQPTPLEIAEFGNKAAENRLKIKSWHVRIEREDFSIKHPELPQQMTVEYYVDGVRHRTDQTRPYKVPVEGLGETYTDYIAEDGKNRYSYSSLVSEEGFPIALTVVPLRNVLQPPEDASPLEAAEFRAATKVADFRVLGFVSTGMNCMPGNFTAIVQNCEKRSDLQMEDDEINGISCKKISYNFRHSRTEEITAYKRFWIAPDQGYSILRHEGEPGDKSFFDRTDVTVEKHEKTGLWVPTQSVFERAKVKDGQPFVSWSERLKLEYLSLNDSIPDKMFTPETMGIPAGRAVHVTPTPAEPMFWDGKKVVSESEATMPNITTRSNTIRYLLIAMGLALICTSCLMKYFEMLKRQREKSGD